MLSYLFHFVKYPQILMHFGVVRAPSDGGIGGNRLPGVAQASAGRFCNLAALRACLGNPADPPARLFQTGSKNGPFSGVVTHRIVGMPAGLAAARRQEARDPGRAVRTSIPQSKSIAPKNQFCCINYDSSVYIDSRCGEILENIRAAVVLSDSC